MASNFKVIFREEEGSPESSPKYEPGCPLLIAAVQISRNTATGDAFLQVRTTNVSNSLAEEVRALATVAYPDGSTEKIPLGGLDADVEPGADHVFTAAKLSRIDAERADVRITLVKGAGEAWESKEEPIEVPLAEELELSDEVRKLRRAHLAGKGCKNAAQAVRKAVDHGAFWSCTCVKGHVNAGDRCVKCGLPKQDALDANDAGVFEKEIEEKKDLERQKKQKRIKNLKSAALAAAVIAMLLFVASQIQHCAATATDGSGTGGYVLTKKASYDSEGEIKRLAEYKLGKHGDILSCKINDYEDGSLTRYSNEFNDYGVKSQEVITHGFFDRAKNKYKVMATDEYGQPTELELDLDDTNSSRRVKGTTKYYWHEKGRVKKIVTNLSLKEYSLEKSTTLNYDESGKLTSTEEDGETYKYEYKYDKQGRVASATSINSDGDKITTRYEYDDHGNMVKVINDDGSYETREYTYINDISPAVEIRNKHFDGFSFIVF